MLSKQQKPQTFRFTEISIRQKINYLQKGDRKGKHYPMCNVLFIKTIRSKYDNANTYSVITSAWQ